MKTKFILLTILLLITLFNPYKVFSHSSHDVIVGNVDGLVYNVDISWGDMKFIYKQEDIYGWENHEYNRVSTVYKWDTKNNYINISNNSSFDIGVECNYQSYNNSVKGVFNNSSLTIKALQKKQISFNLTGALTKDVTTFTKVGKISLGIN